MTTLLSTGLLPAQSSVSVDASFAANEETHPPLRLTPDRSEIITLDENVDRVIIGSDVNINVLLDSSRRIIVVPRAPGATHFTLLGQGGRVIMQRYAIVANPKEKYIRIRETCMEDTECEPVRMYYCPGMCHEISIQGPSSGNSSGASSLTGEGTAPVPAGGPAL